MICSFSKGLALAAGLLAMSLFSATAQTSLVATGSIWRYFDLGAEPAGWRNPLFDDSGWSNGLAQLGFGNDGEVTRLARTNAAGATNITFYFRHTFTVPDPSMFSNLLVRLRRDDGAMVHLNGEEVFRSNLPPGPADYNTLASLAADDGDGLFASPVMISLLVPGANVLAVEVHQSSPASSDVSFDLELLANVTFQAPTVSLVMPGPGDYVGGTQVTLAATAADLDGTITMVEFLEGVTSLGTTAFATNGAFVLTWSNVPPGAYTFRAVAVDSTGLSATSAPVAAQVVAALIPRGAAWKYLDDGSDQGSAWSAAAFNDSGWSNGVAQLGYGDGDETTPIDGGPAASHFITTYFRHSFDVVNPGAYSNLVLRALRDDGVVAYLNGVEIFRNNMPAGTVNHLTPATDVVEETNRFHAGPVSPALLTPGPNVLAVEIHQVDPTSSDVSFDLELLPDIPPMPPHVTIAAPTNNASFLGPLTVNTIITTWDLNDTVISVALYAGNTLLSAAGVDADGDVTLGGVLNPGSHLLRAVATDAGGLSSTSAPVTVQVIPAPLFTTLVATGAVWRYYDTNNNLGTSWREAGYDDSWWLPGAGILGFGTLGAANALPATAINGGPNGARTITAYFRRAFTATNIAAITNLSFRVVRDDGVVVYLNNTELFRMNMGPGNITYVTRATNNVNGTNELFYAPTNLVVTPGLLLEGDNLLAVELHQDMPTTSDGAFDLGLVAVSSPMPPPPTPTITYASPDVLITWPGTGYVLQRAPAPEGPYADLPSASSPYLVPQTSNTGFFRLKRGP